MQLRFCGDLMAGFKPRTKNSSSWGLAQYQLAPIAQLIHWPIGAQVATCCTRVRGEAGWPGHAQTLLEYVKRQARAARANTGGGIIDVDGKVLLLLG